LEELRNLELVNACLHCHPVLLQNSR
jgi:hypothetical protein